MELVISESTIFKKAMEAVRDFLPTPEMNISADGLRITGMDAGHICFVDFLLSPAAQAVLARQGFLKP